jgi:hypothetical protein
VQFDEARFIIEKRWIKPIDRITWITQVFIRKEVPRPIIGQKRKLLVEFKSPWKRVKLPGNGCHAWTSFMATVRKQRTGF